MQLTKNFNLSEFLFSRFYDSESQLRVIKDFMHDKEAQENVKVLAENLQVLRDEVEKSIQINIAYRPKWWELKQGRSGNSKHCLGMAADIIVNGEDAHLIHDKIEKLIKAGKMQQGGLGKYSSFTHYDMRS